MPRKICSTGSIYAGHRDSKKPGIPSHNNTHLSVRSWHKGQELIHVTHNQPIGVQLYGPLHLLGVKEVPDNLDHVVTLKARKEKAELVEESHPEVKGCAACPVFMPLLPLSALEKTDRPCAHHQTSGQEMQPSRRVLLDQNKRSPTAAAHFPLAHRRKREGVIPTHTCPPATGFLWHTASLKMECCFAKGIDDALQHKCTWPPFPGTQVFGHQSFLQQQRPLCFV